MENSAQTHASSTDSIEVRHNQEQEMDMPENEFSFSEVTHQSVSAQIRLATELILRQFEKLGAFLAKGNKSDTTVSTEATGYRRVDTPASSLDNWCDSGMVKMKKLSSFLASFYQIRRAWKNPKSRTFSRQLQTKITRLSL